MTFDTLTIIICAALAMLGILDIIASPLMRRPKSQQNNDNAADSDDNTLPSVSIVLAVHDGEVETERNLPLLLSQDYQGEYEVIVVDESSTDETAEVLKRLKNNHKNLYVTFIPDSSHYVSRRKLALTIGVKAARHEWILFTDADCHPADNQWLKAMAQHCSHDTELVLGATRYDVNATDYERVERIVCWWRNAYEAQKRDVYAYQGHNMMFRRKRFIEGNGFLASLKLLRGEYDFLANEYGKKGKAVVADSLKATMIQDAPTKKSWINDHLYFIETRKYLDNGFAYSFLKRTATALLHINIIAQIAVLAAGLSTQRYDMALAAALFMILTYAAKVFTASKAMKAAGETISPWKVPLLVSTIMWRDIWLKIKHSRCDKYDFYRR